MLCSPADITFLTIRLIAVFSLLRMSFVRSHSAICLSFRLVRNLSLFSEGFPTRFACENDRLKSLLKISFVFLLFFIVPAESSYAQVYQYFDEDGTLIVTDNPFGLKKQTKPLQKKKSEKSISREAKISFRDDVYYDFYETAGSSVFDAMSSTDRLGPYDSHDGKRYAGQTRWNYGLSYNIDLTYRIQEGLIRATVEVRDIDFSSDITVILPELPRGLIPDNHDFSAWEAFLQKLAEHEDDHVRIIRDPALRQEVIYGISGIREIVLYEQPDENAEALIKREIEARAAATAHDVMRGIRNRNDEYDRFTDHGRKHELRNAFFQRM